MDNKDTPKDTPKDIYAADDAQFQQIATQRYMYKAEECGKMPLVGHLLNLLDMPPVTRDGEKQPWSAFLLRTTRPTQALNRDKELVDVPTGSEVLIAATYELAEFFTKAATNKDMIFEVKIAPDKKIPIGGGMKMWTFTLAHKPEPVRRGKFGLAAVLAAPMLPATTTAAAVDTTGDEVPW